MGKTVCRARDGVGKDQTLHKRTSVSIEQISVNLECLALHDSVVVQFVRACRFHDE